MDLILSSGYLAFARHLGVLEALEQRRLQPEAVVGTSSGALVGALFQSGMPVAQIAQFLSARPPLWSMRLHSKPWEGLFSTRQMAALLQQHLPRTFEELKRPLAVGVCDEFGAHRLLHQGDLITAVLASAAIPRLFPAIPRDGRRYVDGGAADRTAVAAWRHWRPDRQAIVHLVARSRGRDVPFDETGTRVVRTPRSQASFWSLGAFAQEQSEARSLATSTLVEALPGT